MALFEEDRHLEHNKIMEKQYIPAFEAKGLPLIFSDMLMPTYGAIGSIHIYTNEMFQQFVDKEQNDRNLEEGLKLYSSEERFAAFQKQLEDVFRLGKNIFPNASSNISRESVEQFFQTTKDIFDAYSRMDPFFTDMAFKESSTNSVTARNVAALQKIKDEYRTDINTFYLENNNYLDQLLSALAIHFSLPRESLSWYLVKELLDLFSHARVSEENLAQRKIAYVQEIGINHFGEEALVIIQKLKKKPEQTKEIRGAVAHKSANPIVKGTVKKIGVDYGNMDAMRTQIEEMQEGQILVAQTTAPELMVACKRQLQS